MKIYCFSGLGADHRVFQYLKLNHEFEVFQWTTPSPKQSLHDYLKQYISQVDQSEEVILIGVSFGGIAAQEFASMINASNIILISSANDKKAIPSYYYLIEPFIRFIPKRLFKPPFWLAKRFFAVKTKASAQLLKQIIDDSDLTFTKWAIEQIVRWQGGSQNCICIHGAKDRVLLPSVDSHLIVNNGGHFTVVEEADQISHFINHTLESS